jgi:hypothetical protein
MGMNRRLRELEGRAGPDPCPACSGWLAFVVCGELAALERDGVEADEHQRAEYLEHTRWERRNGGACVVCGREPLEIRIPGAASL